MAKPNKKSSKTTKKPASQRQPAGRQQSKKAPVMALDLSARRYAALVKDPCYGPLTYGVYEGSSQGILTRFETDFIVNGQAGDTAAFIAFTPSVLGLSTTAYGTVMGASGLLASDTATITPQQLPTRQPGTALAPSMAAARCLSACLQISFVGSELQRSGICSVGQLCYNDVNQTTNTVSTLRALCSSVLRTPDGELEIKLRPTGPCSKFVPVNTVNDPDVSSMPTLVGTMAGIPASTGMRVRLVAVYEWIPLTQSGVVAASTAGSGSNNTINNVLNWLDKTYPTWSVGLLSAASHLAPAITAFL